MPAIQQKIRTGLVELRTKSGPVYVSPKFWERIYLLWTFRNFHSLPRQVLNHRQQELIDKLGRTAVIMGRAPHALIIGAVENVELLRETQEQVLLPPKKLVRMSVPAFMTSQAVGSEEISLPSKRPARAENGHLREPSRIQPISEDRQDSGKLIASKTGARLHWRANQLEGWGRWAVVGLCGLAVVGIRLHFQRSQPAASMAIAQAAGAAHAGNLENLPATLDSIAQTAKIQQLPRDHKQLEKVLVADASAAPSIKLEHASVVPAPLVHEEIAAGKPTTERVKIVEAPKSWSYPVAPDSALTGSVSLKAVVGKDGSVTEVDVLSGRRALALAAARAVKHWRYRAHEINGNAVEAVTNIEIKFLGDDAVSISYRAE